MTAEELGKIIAIGRTLVVDVDECAWISRQYGII